MKKKWVSLLLCGFFGVFGVHKFYEEKIGMGLLYLCMTLGTFFWAGSLVNAGYITTDEELLPIMLPCLVLIVFVIIDFIKLLCKPKYYDPKMKKSKAAAPMEPAQ